MIARRALHAGLAALVALALSGCAAAAIAPVLAGGMLGKKQLERDGGGKAKDIGETQVAGERVPVFSSPPSRVAPAPAPSPVAAEKPAMALPPVPPPGPVVLAGNDGSPYAAFANYAQTLVRSGVAGKGRSVLVDQETIAGAPQLEACNGEPPAVAVDLDPGTRPFDLSDPPRPAPGLAAQLAEIRSAGLTVLWSASVPAEQGAKLYTILQASGLDPDRTDRLLLPRSPGESKQARRAFAAQDWCIIAIAGDRRGDFDEAFDYLRDPDGPVAMALAPNFGAGWFIAPPPID